MAKNNKINVKDTEILIYTEKDSEFISLTDIARYRDAERSDYILQNWMRNRSTIEFIGLWEIFNNPDFNSIEFDGIKNASGSNSFSLTPKRFIEATNAKGIISKTGRIGYFGQTVPLTSVNGCHPFRHITSDKLTKSPSTFFFLQHEYRGHKSVLSEKFFIKISSRLNTLLLFNTAMYVWV